VYLLNHPDHIESVLVSNSHNFVKGRTLRASRALLGDGLLTSEGEFWRRQRRLMQPAFHREHITSFANTIVEFAQRMLASWHPGETRDVHQEMIRLTLQIVAQTFLGVCVEDEAEDVRVALRVFLEQFGNRVNTAQMIPDWLPTPGNLRLGKAIRRLEEIIYDITYPHPLPLPNLREGGGRGEREGAAPALNQRWDNGNGRRVKPWKGGSSGCSRNFS
jgi:cytochrome P450